MVFIDNIVSEKHKKLYFKQIKYKKASLSSLVCCQDYLSVSLTRFGSHKTRISWVAAKCLERRNWGEGGVRVNSIPPSSLMIRLILYTNTEAYFIFSQALWQKTQHISPSFYTYYNLYRKLLPVVNHYRKWFSPVLFSTLVQIVSQAVYYSLK